MATSSTKPDDFVEVKSKSKKRKHEDEDDMAVDQPEQKAKKPQFSALPQKELQKNVKIGMRKVTIPPNRRTPLHKDWSKIYTPIVENLKLQIRYNTKTHQVQIRTCPQTEDIGVLQKAEDFVTAFARGFEIDDAMVLLRLDDIYLESFQVQDVKRLHGDHLGRAIGRLAGTNGTTKYSIENATKTRIVLANNTVHVLGSHSNIAAARRAICNLILGSPPSRVYGTLRMAASLSSKRI